MFDSNEKELNIASSRQYLLTVMTEVKRLKNEILKTEEEINVWSGRITLARERNRSDLEAKATTLLNDLKNKQETQQAELAELVHEVETEKRKLQELKNEPEFSIDADHLLAQFEMLLGEPDTLSAKFKEEEAEVALQELKEKYKNEA